MRASPVAHVALFFLSASVLMLQVALTRIFSVMLWSHYTFLVISIALLGFGAAGSYLSVRPSERDEAQLRSLLARSCLLFGVATIASLLLVTRFGFGETIELSGVFDMGLVYILIATPFFFAGLVVCLMLSSYPGQVNTVYFADLTGAGFGALAVTLLLGSIGAPATIVMACALAAVAGLLFGGRDQRWVGATCALAFVALAAIVVTLDPWTIPVESNKKLATEQRAIEDTHWSLHARIDVLESEVRPLDFGSGVSPELFDRPAAYRTFYMDGTNPSRLILYDQDRWFLPHLLTAAPYGLGLVNPRVLIIGSGGGIDTMVARDQGAKSVTAIEINPVTVELVRGDYSEYIGGIFNDPKVTLLAREGRHFLSTDDTRYDLIRLTGVDIGGSAAAIGANSMDHVYLYTKQAMRDLYHHLVDDGIVAISRPVGWHSLRLLNVMIEGLEEDGIVDVAERMMVVSNGRWNDHLLSRRPYSRDQIEALRSWAASSKLPVIYDPLERRSSRTDRLLRATPAERERLVETHPRNLRAVTDDRPFFFERHTLGGVLGDVVRLNFERTKRSGYPTLLVALLQAVLLGALFILLPLWKNRKNQVGAKSTAKPWSTLGYFALLGLGFIITEMVFIQKYMILLGGPAYSMSVTLFAILVFSGLGALTARYLPISSPRMVVVAPVAVVVLLAVSGWFLEQGLPALLGFGFSARVALGIATLAPVSFALGLPFPLGIRILHAHAPQLIPWAWACNGCLSVVGSVLGVIISMNWGFSAALICAGTCYAFGGLCLVSMLVEPRLARSAS